MKIINFDTSNLLDICQDGVFKAVFTKDTPQSKGALSALVSALILHKVNVLTITANEPPIDDVNDRQIRFDIACKFETGELANVEMTMFPDKFEPIRLEFHSTKLFSGQDIKGKDKSYSDLQYTYQISFLVNRSFYADDTLIHRFEYYDAERNVPLGGRSRIITVELGKLDKVMNKKVSEMTAEEHWSVFFRYLTDQSKRDKINEIVNSEEGIAMASEVLMTISQDERQRAYLTSRYKYILDTQSQMVDARRDGLAEGREEGRKEGLKEGKKEGRKEGMKEGRKEGLKEGRNAVAKNLKDIGISLQQIVQATGLTAEEIEKL